MTEPASSAASAGPIVRDPAGPTLTVVLAAYNMRREVPRTLFTLSPDYQTGVEPGDYEVVVVDNGSSEPLDRHQVEAAGPNVRYRYVETSSKSPAAAINAAVGESTAPFVLCMIDGARMVSPGVLHRALEEIQRYPDGLVYAPSLHLGAQLQNDLVVAGYDQRVEDRLLEGIDWQTDGYRLFDISNIAAVPERLVAPTFEANCFAISRARFLELGGYDEGFTSSGGGLVNWEFFRLAVSDRWPVISLLGEASFHQFHGGAATNHARNDHPFAGWLREYETVTGQTYRYPEYELKLSGTMHPRIAAVLAGANASTMVAVARRLVVSNRPDAGIAVLQQLVADHPNDPTHLRHLAEQLIDVGRFAEARVHVDEAIELAPTQAELHATLGRVLRLRGDLDAAMQAIEVSLELDPLQHEAAFERGLVHRDRREDEAAVVSFRQAIEMNGGPTGAYSVQLAMALADLGDHVEAGGVIRYWLDEHPDDLRAVLDFAELVDRSTPPDGAGDDGGDNRADGAEPDRPVGPIAAEDEVADRLETAVALRRQPDDLLELVERWKRNRRDSMSADSATSTSALEQPGDAGPGVGLLRRLSVPKLTAVQAVVQTAVQDRVRRSGSGAAEAASSPFIESVVSHYGPEGDTSQIRDQAAQGSIGPADAEALAALVERRRPPRILEVGTFLGRGTEVLVRASEPFGSTVTTIDPSVRHRCFDDPQAHARAFVGPSARVSFVRGFFGARTDGGTRYDAAHFEPPIDHAHLTDLLSAAPLVHPTRFELIYLDPGLEGWDFLWTLHSAMESLASRGIVVVRPSGPLVVKAIDHMARLTGASVDHVCESMTAVHLHGTAARPQE